MAQNCLNAQSNRLDPSCEAAHAAAMDCFSGGSVVGDAGGGDMDDVMRRLGAVETDISGMKADISDMKVDISGIKAVIPHLATKADVSDMKTSIIQWIVATTIAAAGVAFAIAKFVH
jgi:hypothetical protein